VEPSSVSRIIGPVEMAADLTLYLDAVHRGDRREAIGVAIGLLERGMDPESIITNLLARAQSEIGRGWQEGRWSVALEHRASAITESAVQAVADTALRAPGAVVEGSAGRAVVACSEGEWHVLPGRMAAEVLRLRGADVSFVGPSVPAAELAEMIGDDPPSAVAVTCSMPASLSGAWRTITAMRTVGMTVIIGGRGFGPDGRWGLALGADAWAPSFSTGADLLLASLQGPPSPPREPLGEPATVEELRILDRDHEALVEAGTARALAAWPYLRQTDAAQRATRADLASTLRVVASADLFGDAAIVTEYVTWFESVLAARDLPLAFVSTAFSLLLDVLPARLARARGFAQAGRAACSAAPLSL
jgi:methanogenic corrinoid protein MtbC1